VLYTSLVILYVKKFEIFDQYPQVVAIDPKQKKIQLQDGKEIAYEKLLLATGL
jgi:NADH dehydrogenase FAD-containing subunit